MVRSLGVVVVLMAISAAAADESRLRQWMMPDTCTALPVRLSAGSQIYQLLTEDQPEFSFSSVKTGCLQTAADGQCELAADDSETACWAAALSGDAFTALEGQLSVAEDTTGFVYVSNSRSHPILADMLVVTEPAGSTAAESTVGTYRRSLLRRGERSPIVADTAEQQAPLRPRAHRRMLDSSSDNDNDSASNWIDRVSNQVSPKARKWVKIAIIILIVLVCISILSCLICIIKCICWPCCCAARAFK